MSNERKYPYIAKGSMGQIFLVHKARYGIHLEGVYKGEAVVEFSEIATKDITKEYLKNTYGKVESEAHREMLIKLAENAGFGIDMAKLDWFCFLRGFLYFFSSEEIASNAGEKLITLPLPPEKTSDDWLQVGDEVTWGLAVNWKVIAIHGDEAWLEHNSQTLVKKISDLQKPKSDEDKLRDEVQTHIANQHLSGNISRMADVLFEKYNITRKDK